MPPKESFQEVVERMQATSWHRPYHAISRKMRLRREGLFESLISTLSKPVEILVIDGRPDPWMARFPDESDAHVVILNMREVECDYDHIETIVGDARDMSTFRTDQFDFVYSNSVIEHVGTWEDQRRMAEEVRRVGRHYFIQTPNFWFPIEPHFLAPGFQLWPRGLRAWSIRRWDLGPYGTGTFDKAEAYERVDEVRLLRKRELEALFPGAVLWEEKIVGLTKSFVACGGWDAATVGSAAHSVDRRRTR